MYSRSPSTIGLGLARLFLLCISLAAVGSGWKISTFHAIVPFRTSTQSVRSETRSASSTAVVRYNLPRDNTGDDQPVPGIVCFQTTFSVALQESGTSAAFETPLPFGPRNCGQSRADVESLSAKVGAAV